MKGINGFYILVLALFLGMLFISQRYFRGSSHANIGIAYAKEYKISSEMSGTVNQVHVVPGQEVKAGDLLVEMENAALEIELAKLTSQIEALKKEKEEKNSLLQSKIAYLKAEGGIQMEELEAEIQQIQSELALNRKLTEQFLPESKNKAGNTEKADPGSLRVSSLEDRKKLYRQAMGIRIDDFMKDHQASMLVLDNQIDLKERELALMLSEKEKLRKYATHDGVVSNVFVRGGEEVEAFASILSINPKHPSTVVGYVVGSNGREISVGEKVSVSAYNHKNLSCQGEVIGFGSIVELPEILQKSTAVKAFGKEVFIKIPEDNAFANGEKVLIR